MTRRQCDSDDGHYETGLQAVQQTRARDVEAAGWTGGSISAGPDLVPRSPPPADTRCLAETPTRKISEFPSGRSFRLGAGRRVIRPRASVRDEYSAQAMWSAQGHCGRPVGRCTPRESVPYEPSKSGL